jgi:hypothetical protein
MENRKKPGKIILEISKNHVSIQFFLTLKSKEHVLKCWQTCFKWIIQSKRSNHTSVSTYRRSTSESKVKDKLVWENSPVKIAPKTVW